MVDEQGEDEAGHQEELNPERVVVVVVGGPELHVHQVNRGIGGYDEHKLHNSVICRYVGRQQIQVPGCVHYGEQNLGLARYTCT